MTGQRRELSAATCGRLSWYQDAPAHTAQPPLLLIHSVNAAASAYEVKPLYEHFRDLRPVYAPDLPGFGLSERGPRGYSPRLMTDAIHALLAEIQVQHGDGPVDAIALSLSAEFLARAANEAPQALRSLALVSPTGFERIPLRHGPPGSTLGKPWLDRLFGGPTRRRTLFRLLTRRRVIRYFLRRTWGSRDIDEGLLHYDVLMARAPGAEHAPLRFLGGHLFSRDSGNLYRDLTQPVWVVHGTRGDFVTYEGLSLFKDNPSWSIEVLPTGALPHFEALPDFLQRYQAWSDRVPPLRGASPPSREGGEARST
jgi:pimeloyl-ACP methyl ester carboxylesterase